MRSPPRTAENGSVAFTGPSVKLKPVCSWDETAGKVTKHKNTNLTAEHLIAVDTPRISPERHFSIR